MRYLDSRTNSLKKAASINAIAKYSIVAISLLFSALLARLLTPEEYGIIAVITVFTNFFLLFSDMGIGVGIIQYKTLTREDEDRIFTLTIFFGIILMVMFSLFSLVLDKIYHKDIYRIIGPILAISLAFRTFNIVPGAKLLREKMFVRAAVRDFVSTLVGYIAAVIIAFYGGRYYSLVVQSVISAVFLFLWNLGYAKVRINTHHMFQSLKIILRYSTYQFFFNILNFFSGNIDNLLVGVYFGDVQLGYYNKAYQLMRYPVINLTHMITPAVQPILSDHQHNAGFVMERFVKMTRLLAVIGVFLGSISFFASNEIILLYFGDQWNNAVESFRYLSLSVVFQMVGGLTGSIYQSLNRTDIMFWSGVIGTAVFVLAIVTGINLGSIAMLALCVSAAGIVNFFKSQWFLSRFCFKVSLWKLLREYGKALLIMAAMFIALYFVPAMDNLFVSFLRKLLVGSVVYAGMLFLTKEYKVLYDALPGRWKRKKVPKAATENGGIQNSSDSKKD